LQRLWEQFDAADRRDAAVAARAALRAVALGSLGPSRATGCGPSGTAWANWSATTATPSRWRLFDAAPGIEHEWLQRLEIALDAHGHEAAVVVAVGMAFADRQLWGKARKLLEQSAGAAGLPLRARRRAWRALAQMAREGGDEARAQDCERAAAALE
jgi:HemY protein